MKADGGLRSLLQGVSQQPARDRLPGQGSVQENMSSDPITGLTRRPSTDLVGFLGSSSNVRGWHNFSTRDGGKFLSFFHDSTVDVFDLNTVAQTVVVDGAAAPYIALGGSMRFMTNEDDETIVANSAAVPAMTSSQVTYFNTPLHCCAIIQVLGGAYGKTSAVTLNGTVIAAYRPPDGSTPTDAAFVSTSHIANRLAGAMFGNPPGTTNPDGATSELLSTNYLGLNTMNLYQKDDVLLIEGGLPFSLTVTDGAGDVNIKAVVNTVTDVADLPRIAPHLYVVRVAQQTDPDKDLWFKFIAESNASSLVPDVGAFGNYGYWQECVGQGTNTEFDKATMPHYLTYNGASFQFSQVTWNARAVGTDVSNPNPSFIGKPIRDVSSFQGRTVFLAGSNVIMSRNSHGKTKDFWQGSASALIDTDPIDINSKAEAGELLAAVQHNKDLVCFSREGQFVVFGRTAVIPTTAALTRTTSYEAQLDAAPVGAGRNIFFAADFGRFTAIREFFTEGGTDINDSRPITQHVKRFIEGHATLLTSSANYDTLIVHTDATKTSVYPYQYIWSDTEKVQSAWSKWLFEHDIVHSFFDGDVVYLVQEVSGVGFFLLRMHLDVQDSEGVGYPVMLDQRFDVLNCNTQFQLPFAYLHTADLVCVQGANCPNPGLTVGIESIELVGSDYVVTLKSDMQGGDLLIGTRYLSRYRPTMPLVKDSEGVAVSTGKLVVRAFIASLYKTGEAIGRMFSKWGNGPEVKFNGRTVGDIGNVIGVQPIVDAKFTMPFRCNADEAEVEFYTNSHLPMTFLDIEWQGQYTKRGRRITQGGK